MKGSIGYTIIIIFLLLFFSCNNGVNNSKEKVNTAYADTFVKDIPAGLEGHLRDELNLVLRRLSLPSIENGFAGLKIRIYKGYVFRDTVSLVTLTRKDGAWEADVTRFSYEEVMEGHSVKVAANSSQLTPLSGWKKFTDSLFALDIRSLPHSDDIAAYPYASDGDNVAIEIADRKGYRVYSYPNADYIQDDVPEARKIADIVRLVEKELSIKL